MDVYGFVNKFLIICPLVYGFSFLLASETVSIMFLNNILLVSPLQTQYFKPFKVNLAHVVVLHGQMFIAEF